MVTDQALSLGKIQSTKTAGCENADAGRLCAGQPVGESDKEEAHGDRGSSNINSIDPEQRHEKANRVMGSTIIKCLDTEHKEYTDHHSSDAGGLFVGQAVGESDKEEAHGDVSSDANSIDTEQCQR